MPRVKFARLLLLFLLVALTLIYLLNRHFENSREDELQQLNEQADQLLQDINNRRRGAVFRQREQEKEREQKLQTIIGVKPRPHEVDYRGGPVRGIYYHRMKQERQNFLKLGRNLDQKGIKVVTVDDRSTSLNKKNLLSVERSVNKTRTSLSFTERFRTEIEEKRKEYLKLHANISKVLLGREFNVEAYLSPQRFKGPESDAMKRFQFNQQASDTTSYNRSLMDIRNQLCRGKYKSSVMDINQLPSTTVVICFHNEARSALLRTVYSVLSHSPAKLLEEILLVDDFSDNSQDGESLSVIPKVNLIRLKEREGLIRARLVGAKAAKGQVLTFLDSHCEVTPGWLQPLLVRIHQDSHHVVSPVIDIIRKDSMKYNQANSNIRGGFGHNLYFKWDNLNSQELQDRRIDNAAPIRTPAIAGGLFSIDKTYFEYIGSYDDQMEIWGGENVEMSMRVWMCGGTLEIMPCSHVGHIFRSSMPYNFGKGRSYHTTVTRDIDRNLRRTAEVWMDDYKYLFYKSNPAAESIPFGNISSRLQLKKELQCKSFNWFIDNVYPEFVPAMKGEVVKNTSRLMQKGVGCLQCQDPANGIYRLTMKPCDLESKENSWSFTTQGHMKHYSLCLTATNTSFPPQLSLSFCLTSNDPSQIFDWTRVNSSVQIKHKSSGFCMASQVRTDTTGAAVLQTCDSNNKSQNWIFTKFT